jgi:hypothetical protein
MVEMGRRSLESIHVEDIDKLIPDQAPQQPSDPKTELEKNKQQATLAETQAQMQLNKEKQDHAMQIAQVDQQFAQHKQQADLMERQAQMQLAFEKQELDKAKVELDQKKFELEQLRFQLSAQVADAELVLQNQKVQGGFALEADRTQVQHEHEGNMAILDTVKHLNLKAMDIDANKQQNDVS